MDSLNAFRNLLRSHGELMIAALAELDDHQALSAPNPSAAWIAAHLHECLSEVQALVCGSRPTEDTPPLEDLVWLQQVQTLEQRCLDLNDALSRLCEKDLDHEPAGGLEQDLGKGSPSRREVLAGHVGHMGWHLGQLARIRSQLGLTAMPGWS
ncbi:MAG TPA: hypothetical protein EYQ25_04480 [Planctomycetes bacterium]|nr:hypothetical protein [Planctomycetota bacterium]HIL38675.1 hypothetical protein [Planctomycetota bacterium]